MELDKSVLLQKQVKDNSEDLQSEFLDMKNWEEQMKRKDEELRKDASGEVTLPPIRSKKKKPVQKSDVKQNDNVTQSKRIKSYDYSSWDKFDVDKACKEIDKETQSDDSEGEVQSKEELEKAHEIATKHKEEGNIFVKQQKWDKAVGCYSQAIKAFPYDAVFYANRALCQLKLDNLHSAEADCSAAVQLDETYVKAYHRRATARMGLKQYKEAKQDVEKVLKLEPSNKEAKSLVAQLQKKIESSKPVIVSGEDLSNVPQIEKKIGEKLWSCTKPSTQKTDKGNSKTGSIKVDITKSDKRVSRIPDWLPEKNDVAVVEPVDKPPHLRSKEPLTRIPVEEVEFGISRPKTEEKETSHENRCTKPEVSKDKNTENKNGSVRAPETVHCTSKIPPAPKTAVQFLMDWKRNNSLEFRYKYLKQLPADRLPKIFQDSMESDIFDEILSTLRIEFIKNKDSVFSYLKQLSQVKRFRALIMFLSKSDKENLKSIFEYCKTEKNLTEQEIAELSETYEI